MNKAAGERTGGSRKSSGGRVTEGRRLCWEREGLDKCDCRCWWGASEGEAAMLATRVAVSVNAWALQDARKRDKEEGTGTTGGWGVVQS